MASRVMIRRLPRFLTLNSIISLTVNTLYQISQVFRRVLNRLPPKSRHIDARPTKSRKRKSRQSPKNPLPIRKRNLSLSISRDSCTTFSSYASCITTQSRILMPQSYREGGQKGQDTTCESPVGSLKNGGVTSVFFLRSIAKKGIKLGAGD
jgi:hypothetical protein